MKKIYKQLNNLLYHSFYSVLILAIVLQHKFWYQQVNKGQNNATIAKCHQIEIVNEQKLLINYFISIYTILKLSNNYSDNYLKILDFGGRTWLKKVDKCAQALIPTL